jgi:Uncharacterized protein conserved in bacteria
MKKHLTYATAIFFAMTMVGFAAGADTSGLEAKEKAAWQAYKDKKPDDFKKVVSANMMAVYSDGIQDLQKELAGMKDWDMKSFTISDYKVTAISADTAVSTYTVKIEGTVSGKDASGTMNAGSVWKQEGGDWKAIFHTNVAQTPAAK